MPKSLQVPSTEAESKNDSHTTCRTTRAMNIRGVPDTVWCRARVNAIQSRMSVKDYVIRVLSQSEPFTQT